MKYISPKITDQDKCVQNLCGCGCGFFVGGGIGIGNQ